MEFNKGWYLIYTRPCQEKSMTRRLTEQGIEAYLPLIRSLRQWHDRKKYIDQPLFPSYVFVYFESRRTQISCMDIEGFLYLVKIGNKLARIADSIIRNIRLAAEYGRHLEVSSKDFTQGQQLVVRSGPLTGLSGEMVRFDGKAKVLIRVNLLQRCLLVTLQAEDLMISPNQITQ